ncbi:alpha/beta hydrolase [Actinoplanes sp. NPDC023936]|uniref:alpha/beta hydrolase n=1 Tax=Actinoplanes sp. NPDC023936 TaxID=3154910 RepID=UPI0033C64702
MRTQPEVETATGAIRGNWRDVGDTAFAEFLGVPYAEPPVGPLRFAAPVPTRPWKGTRNATTYGPTAMQHQEKTTGGVPQPTVPGDATLSLNVFTPDTNADTALPVVVFIHGNDFVTGTPLSPWNDGRGLARSGIVLVTVSYRLGFEGFGLVPGAPLNRGALDWLLALEWVQENIRLFGGDPHRVTVTGHSAGATAVLELLAMPRAQALFHRAFAASPRRLHVSLESAEKTAIKVARLAHVPFTREGLTCISRATMSTLETKILGGTIGTVRSMLAGGHFGPVVDGELITRPAIQAIAAGVGADKPLIIGSLDDEFTSMLADIPRALSAVPADVLLRLAGVPSEIRSAYLAARPDPRERSTETLERLATDRIVRSTVLATAEARGSAPTWLYRFAWGSRVHTVDGRPAALHNLDIPFLFDVLDDPTVATFAGPSAPQSVADEFHGTLVDLATSGAANWPCWSGARIAHVFDDHPHDEADSYHEVDALLPTYRIEWTREPAAARPTGAAVRAAAAPVRRRTRPSLASTIFTPLIAALARKAGDTSGDLPRARRVGDKAAAIVDPPTRRVHMTQTELGGVPVYRFSSGPTTRGVVLFLHGGAYVVGSALAARGRTARICLDGGPDVVSVQYRLAPEHPYPAALEDALAVYRELIALHGPQRVLVSGESAGGGLAIALLQRVQHEGLPQPAALLTQFPWTDLTVSGASATENRERDVLNHADIVTFASLYAGDHELREPGISPLYGSFEGFPTTYILVGTRDLVRDDSRRVAEKMRAEGVDVQLDEWEGGSHGFTGMPFPEGREAQARMNAFILANLPDRSETVPEHLEDSPSVPAHGHRGDQRHGTPTTQHPPR